jgi:hypothetical protein
MRFTFVILLLLVAVAAVLLIVIPRKKASPPPPPEASAALTAAKGTPAGQATTNRNVVRRQTTNIVGTGRNVPALQIPRTNSGVANRPGKNPDQPPADPVQLEAAYRNTTDDSTKFEIIDQLTDMDNLAALQALDRLFQGEKDVDMKVEILESIQMFDGNNPYKLQLLSLAARQGQPKEIRSAAIDGMLDLDDKSVIPVLQTLRNDPDPDIREEAKDALEFYQD